MPAPPPAGASDNELAAGIGGRGPDEAFLLLLGAVVPDGHQTQTIDQHRRPETRIDGLYLFCSDHEVNVGHPAAPILLGQHGESDTLLARLHVSRLGELEAAQRIRLFVDLLCHRREETLCKIARSRLDFLLLSGECEIDSHASSSYRQAT
jgi:hypothetical protein